MLNLYAYRHTSTSCMWEAHVKRGADIIGDNDQHLETWAQRAAESSGRHLLGEGGMVFVAWGILPPNPPDYRARSATNRSSSSTGTSLGTPRHVDRLDERQHPPAEGGWTHPERLGRLRPGVGESHDLGCAANASHGGTGVARRGRSRGGRRRCRPPLGRSYFEPFALLSRGIVLTVGDPSGPRVYQ